ncbi:class I SAM-dependent methyltransferase [Anaerobaca lacustris]|uniref:Methyltransferase domain-containing protein n=1 Tax=Anaerobaca lacustris TaxID=3044600 RepID=A0AAW6TZW1_9BACT|nr:methyltransferase domain-containing protein [Sedimentisphaerales bacterium M17dextr]
MRIADIVTRSRQPRPWVDADKIPWYEPGFSRRMLREHLSQEHDLASRRFVIVEEHVRWIHHHVLRNRPARILDLGCGPGLYTSRLAKLGHSCVGIDYSPASIEYAREQAARPQPDCTYVHGDMRTADFGTGFDLVMMVFGELNVFHPSDARTILAKARRGLARNGVLLLEPHRFSAIEQLGRQGPSWHTAESGLFSDAPHIWLEESLWNSASRTAVQWFFVIDASTGNVTRHGQTMQAYTDEEYRSLLTDCGFKSIELLASLGTTEDAGQHHLMAILAR